MHSFVRNAFALIALALLCMANTADAQDAYFPNNATLNSYIFGYAVVGYANVNNLQNRQNGTSPTVNVVDNAGIQQSLLAYNSSTVNISQRSGQIIEVGNGVFAYNHSTVNVSANVPDGVQLDANNSFANDSSTINLYSGAFSEGLAVQNSGTVNLYTGSHVNQEISTYNSGKANISGGRIDGLIYATDSGIVNMSGGTLDPTYYSGIGQGVRVSGNGTINLSGGKIGNSSSTEQFTALDSGTLNCYGGSFSSLTEFVASNSSTLNFYGTKLGDTLVGSNSVYNIYSLSGQLSDGNSITGLNLAVAIGDNVTVNFHNTATTPAPSSVLVVLLGAVPLVGVLRRRRK